MDLKKLANEYNEEIKTVALLAVEAHAEVEGFTVWGAPFTLSEEAKSHFSVYKEHYEEVAEEYVRGNQGVTPDMLRDYLKEKAGLHTEEYEIVAWSDCAVAFYLQGVEEKVESDIVFPPGKYAFNMHTILDWETMTHVNDVWYIMSPDSRHYEDNELAYPAIWRDFPEGITVRKISKYREDGSHRPYFENKDEYVFICSVPDKLTIHGEEFVWWG